MGSSYLILAAGRRRRAGRLLGGMSDDEFAEKLKEERERIEAELTAEVRAKWEGIRSETYHRYKNKRSGAMLHVTNKPENQHHIEQFNASDEWVLIDTDAMLMHTEPDF